MKKFLKIMLWTTATIVALVVLFMIGFLYKVKNGFPVSYETDVPAIAFPAGQPTVLLFSKATGFRHAESIDAGKKVFAMLADRNNWFLYETEEGGIFNAEQLSKFDLVIFNNSTGRVLNEEQQKMVEEYVEKGGDIIGIHGSGDNSHHHWAWYEQNFIGARFSHHSLNPQLQETEVILSEQPDSVLAAGLPATWKHTDEWYVFLENPRANGFHVIYSIDGEKINPDGNILWIRDNNFGMGKDHPVAWYRETGKGRTFYTSIGHNASAWEQEPFVRMLENAVRSAVN